VTDEHTARRWQEVPTVDSSSEGKGGADEPGVAGSGYLELPDNGWGMLVAYVAGPRRTRRVADRLQDHRTVLLDSGRSGPAETVERERTDEDQDLIEEMTNEYLDRAGVPSRPRGYKWFLALPPCLQPYEPPPPGEPDFVQELDNELGQEGAVIPSPALRERLSQLLNEKYAGQ
jgi:hypothetical protein